MIIKNVACRHQDKASCGSLVARVAQRKPRYRPSKTLMYMIDIPGTKS